MRADERVEAGVLGPSLHAAWVVAVLEREHVALLRELGVTHGQGFRLGEPQPLERFLAELQPAEEEPIGSA